MDAGTLASLMADNAAQIAEHLLPQGKRVAREWKAGSVAGEAGQSLSVCLSGARRGMWKDFAAGCGGDMLDLWAQVRAQSIAQAMQDAARFLGVRTEAPKRAVREWKRPPKVQCTAPKSDVVQWFGKRRITPETLRAFRLGEATHDGKTYALFPYLRDGEVINVKHRNIADKKDMRQESGAEPCLFGWHLIDPKARRVAICEGEIDALTLHQMNIPALSANAGAGNHQWIDNDWERLERFDEIYLCYDNDEAGQKGAKEVADRLGMERCKLVTFPLKDANDYLQTGATAEDFFNCFAQARTFDPDELKAVTDFWGGVKARFYPAHDGQINPLLRLGADKFPWFEFRPGELTVWTGYNGHGKSLLLNQVLIGLMDAGQRVCVFSGEMTPEQQGKRLAKQLGGVDRPTIEYLDVMADWLWDRMWLFALTGTATIDRLIKVFTYGYKRYGIRHFVIDSLMMTDVPEDGSGALSAQKEAMRKLTAFVRAHGTHVHLVAHPRKGRDEKDMPGKMDIAGSSKISDAADNVFSVWSAQKEDGEESDKPDAALELLKNRNGDVQHRKLWLYFNRTCMQFGISKYRNPYAYIPYSREEAWKP